MLLTLVWVVDLVRVLLVDNLVTRPVLLVTVFPTSVLMVDMADVLAASSAAATGELFAEYAAMVLVLYTMVLMAVLMATLEQVKCGATTTVAGTSKWFLSLAV